MGGPCPNERKRLACELIQTAGDVCAILRTEREAKASAASLLIVNRLGRKLLSVLVCPVNIDRARFTIL